MTLILKLLLVITTGTSTSLYSMEKTSHNNSSNTHFSKSQSLVTLEDITNKILSIKIKIVATNTKTKLIPELLRQCNYIEHSPVNGNKQTYIECQKNILDALNDIIIHLMYDQEHQLILHIIQKLEDIRWKEYAENFTTLSLRFQMMKREAQCQQLEKRQKKIAEELEWQTKRLILTQFSIQEILYKAIETLDILYQQLCNKQITPDKFVNSFMHHHHAVDTILNSELASHITQEIQNFVSNSFYPSINRLIESQQYRQALVLINNILSLKCPQMNYLQKIHHWDFMHNLKHHIVKELIEKKRNKALKKFNTSLHSTTFTAHALCKKFSCFPSWLATAPMALQTTIKSTISIDLHSCAYTVLQYGNLKAAEEIVNYALSLQFSYAKTSDKDYLLHELREHLYNIKQSSSYATIEPQKIFSDTCNSSKDC